MERKKPSEYWPIEISDDEVETVALTEDFKLDRTPDCSIDSSLESESSDEENEKDAKNDEDEAQEKEKRRADRVRALKWKAERMRRLAAVEAIKAAQRERHSSDIAPLRDIFTLGGAAGDAVLMFCGNEDRTLLVHRFVVGRFYPRLFDFYPELKKGHS